MMPDRILIPATFLINVGGPASWKDASSGKILKFDVVVAKNYLAENELAQMQRIVFAYLDMAEVQAMRRISMSMQDWEERLGGILELWDRKILQDAGKVSTKSPRRTPKANSRNTESCRIACSKVISTA